MSQQRNGDGPGGATANPALLAPSDRPVQPDVSQHDDDQSALRVVARRLVSA